MKHLFFVALMALMGLQLNAQNVTVSKALFKQGDDMNWAKPEMDDFTLNLLCNNEVNAIDQDLLGKQADRTLKEGDIEVWSRPLADGAFAVGIFNVGEKDQKVDMKALLNSRCSMFNVQYSLIRDLWRQKNLSEGELNCTIPLHGCRYLKVKF